MTDHRIFAPAAGSGLAIIPPGELKRADGRPNFDYIRKMYEAMLPEILASERWIDPYFVDWVQILTPIEMAMWSLIRSQPVPYYPQMPVGRFFVDFGNPAKRIAIECDGKQWHDPDRDNRRDIELEAMGWTAFHFSGRACFLLGELPNLPLWTGPARISMDTSWGDHIVEQFLDGETLRETGEWLTEETVD